MTGLWYFSMCCQYFVAGKIRCMCSTKTGDVNNNIETILIAIISMLMQLLLEERFERCFNFFITWARTQRPPLILFLLEGHPVLDMYKFINKAMMRTSFILISLWYHWEFGSCRCYFVPKVSGDLMFLGKYWGSLWSNRCPCSCWTFWVHCY